MNEAIKLAIEKGGLKNLPKKINDEFDIWETDGNALVLDPLFWIALGKALGNKEIMICDSPNCDSQLCEYAGYKNPKDMFDGYMTYVWYDGDTEKFWEDLLKNNLCKPK